MIVKKSWKKQYSRYSYHIYTGWFLFGIIPLYIERRSFE